MDRATLERAYRSTSYRAGDIVLRVGERHPALDELLARHGLDTWAYLTAHNPRSVALPAAENDERQARLLVLVAQHIVYLGDATSDAGDWAPEPSVLVLGIDAMEAEALARAFEQNAILVGRRGGRTRLAWIEASP